MDKTLLRLTDQQFAHLGGGVLGYVKQIEVRDAVSMLGSSVNVPPNTKLFCLYNADGRPISISGSREAAVGNAMQNDLIAASLH
jgi:hypothetical protein